MMAKKILKTKRLLHKLQTLFLEVAFNTMYRTFIWLQLFKGKHVILVFTKKIGNHLL